MLINRAALVLKATQAAVDWINEVTPAKDNIRLTVQDVNADSLVYLLAESVQTESQAHAWALSNVQALMEEFLSAWCLDEAYWPKDIGPQLFEKWVQVEYHSMIIDTVNADIQKEAM